MWKKEEAATPSSAGSADSPSRTDRSSKVATPGGRAIIGPSISIRGEVTGDEDLLIQGKVDGSVDLKQHSVTVGPEGKVKAGIAGRVVVVEGTVEGDLKAEEQVILRGSATVQGDITAPRVILEDGARFRGGVDMGDPAGRAKPASTIVSPPTEKAADRSPSPEDPGKSTPSTPGKGKDSATAPSGSRG
jgi:cytoskeletal protein CcmA (bactofilin family)